MPREIKSFELDHVPTSSNRPQSLTRQDILSRPAVITPRPQPLAIHTTTAASRASKPSRLSSFVQVSNLLIATHYYTLLHKYLPTMASSLRIATRAAPLFASRAAIRPTATFLSQQKKTFATTPAKMSAQGTSSGQPIATLDVSSQ